MPDLIPALPREVAVYIRCFGIVAVAVYSDGRTKMTHNPAGAVVAWWMEDPHEAGKLALLAANAVRPADTIVALAAKRGVSLTEHAVVVERAKAAMSRISDRLSRVQARGDLKFFNAEFKRRRIEAQARGDKFITYGEARARLQREITKVAATGGTVTPALVASVFTP